MITSDPFIESDRVASEVGNGSVRKSKSVADRLSMMARLRRAQPTTNLTREIFFELEITIQAKQLILNNIELCTLPARQMVENF
jgi:hypothetical protein